jgi:hypothetical protein
MRRVTMATRDELVVAVPPCKAGSAEGMVGEHLNEATITRLGSILECGNMSSHVDCRAAWKPSC